MNKAQLLAWFAKLTPAQRKAEISKAMLANREFDAFIYEDFGDGGLEPPTPGKAVDPKT